MACDREQARTLAREILDARLATVVNLIGPAEKLHWWEGEITGPGTGWQVEMQTTAARFEALDTFPRKHRFLEPMPEVIATPLSARRVAGTRR
jgi:uncharacterized protein involved in tolerance to divalent cations